MERQVFHGFDFLWGVVVSCVLVWREKKKNLQIFLFVLFCSFGLTGAPQPSLAFHPIVNMWSENLRPNNSSLAGGSTPGVFVSETRVALSGIFDVAASRCTAALNRGDVTAQQP
jgi:hypothetical protein